MPGDWGDERGERVSKVSRQPLRATEEQRAEWRALGREAGAGAMAGGPRRAELRQDGSRGLRGSPR